MASVVIEIADAVTAALNAASLSQTFVAERAYVPVHELKDLVDLKVTVVPASLSMVTLSRRDDDFDYVIDIGIQKRIANTTAGIDPFMTLAEEIVDLFRGVKLTGYETALCVAAANAPIYSPQHIDEYHLFTTVISLTFRKARAR